MNKRNLIIASIAALCLIFAGCTMDQTTPDAKGSLTVRAGYAEGSRGSDPGISMETTYYTIKGVGPNDSFGELEVPVSSPTVTIDELTAGEWTVTATAFNSDGNAIGGGEAKVTVTPGTNTTCRITVAEYEGDGTFTLMLSGLNEAKGNYTIEVFDSTGQNKIHEKTKTAINGNISVTIEKIENGFYNVVVTPPADSNLPEFIRAFRIVKGYDTTVRYAVAADGQIEIENIITTTPNIEIVLDYKTIPVNENIRATANVSNLPDDAVTTWYLGANEIGNESRLDYQHSLSAGTSRILTYEVRIPSKNLVWNESVVINIIAEIIQPRFTVNTSDLSFAYGQQKTIAFQMANSSNVDVNNWTYKWYIDDVELDGQSDYASVTVNTAGDIAVGTHKLELKGTYSGERTYSLYSSNVTCYPSITTETSVIQNIYEYQRINLKATVTPELGNLKVKWIFTPASSGYSTTISYGVETVTTSIGEEGEIKAQIVNDADTVFATSAPISVLDVSPAPDLAIRWNGAIATEAVVYRQEGDYNSYYLNSFNVVSTSGATYKWYVNGIEVNTDDYNTSSLYLNVNSFKVGDVLELQVGMLTDGVEEIFSEPITLTVDEMPYLSSSVTYIYSAGPTDIEVRLIDNTGKVSSISEWSISPNGNEEWFGDTVASEDGKTLTVKVNPPVTPPYSYYNFSFYTYVTYVDAKGIEHSDNVHTNLVLAYGENSHSSSGPLLALDNRLLNSGSSTPTTGITASLSDLPRYSSAPAVLTWYLNDAVLETFEDFTGTSSVQIIDVSGLEAGVHYVRAEYVPDEYNHYYFSTYFIITDEPIDVDKVYYKQIFNVGETDEVGYEVIVVDEEHGLYEKSVVLYSSSDTEDNFTVKTTGDNTSALNIEGYKEISGIQGLSDYSGEWKMPNITADNGFVNKILDRFVNNMQMMTPYFGSLVELASGQDNSVDAYFTIDESFLTVFADIQLSATGLDGGVVLPAVFNPQAEATFEYTYVEDEVVLDGNALGLSFRPSSDGSVLVLTAYIPMGNSAEKIVLPLERVSEVKTLPRAKGFIEEKSIRLGDELPQIAKAVNAVEKMNDFIMDTLYAYPYGTGEDVQNYGGEWVLDQQSLDKLPAGVPSTWVASAGSVIGFDSDGKRYIISRYSGSGGFDTSIIGESLSVDGGIDYYSKDLIFSVNSITESSISFDLKAASNNAPYTVYEGLTLNKSSKTGGELIQDMITNNVPYLEDAKVTFKTDGTVSFSMDVRYGSGIDLEVGTYSLNSDNTITIVVNMIDLMLKSGMPDTMGIPNSSAIAITLSYDAGTGKITVLELPKANDSVTLTLK